MCQPVEAKNIPVPTSLAYFAPSLIQTNGGGTVGPHKLYGPAQIDVDTSTALAKGSVLVYNESTAKWNVQSNTLNIGYGTYGNTPGSVNVGVRNATGTQGQGCLTLGYQTGINQSDGSIAIGFQAAGDPVLVQNEVAVALGNRAGFAAQGLGAVAIGGRAAGWGSGGEPFTVGQGQGSVALGYQAAYSPQGDFALALGPYAGYSNQEASCVAVGDRAAGYGNDVGETDPTFQGSGAIALGSKAGYFSQGNNSIALGVESGLSLQNSFAIAIGYQAAGYKEVAPDPPAPQNSGAIAIGSTAGYRNQGGQSIGIGNQAGYQDQGQQSVAIGKSAGLNTQGQFAIAIGSDAGGTTQGAEGLALGTAAGSINQGTRALALGYQSGSANQLTQAISIGSQSGYKDQGQYAVAIGSGSAGYGTGPQETRLGGQNDYSVAIGYNSAYFKQGFTSVAVGYRAAGYAPINTDPVNLPGQGEGAIAIGADAAYREQGDFSIAIGHSAGFTALGTNSIAIGQLANNLRTNFNNTIVISATGVALNPDKSNACFLAPVRDGSADPVVTTLNTVQLPAGFKVMAYNAATSEVITVGGA